MKKSVLHILSVSALSLVGSNVFALDVKGKSNTKDQKVALESSNTLSGSIFSKDQIDALKKELEKKDVTENKVTFSGVLQFNANTSDSQRSNAPDFQASKVRFGANISGGIVSGQAEIGINGNQSSTLTVSNQETVSDAGNGSITLRRAQLNLDVLNIKNNENSFLTTISIGGIRLGSADGTAPDAAWTTSGFGRQDGVYLKETLSLGKATTLEIGAGAFNNIIAVANPTYPTSGSGSAYGGWGAQNPATLEANWTGTSFSQSMGYAGHIAAGYTLDDNQTLALKALYGSQDNSPVSQTAADSSGSSTLASVKNVTHMEASLSYNHANIFGSNGVLSGNGVTLWYESEDIGKTKTATRNSSGDFNYTSGTDDSQTVTLIGLGASGDSANYLTGMLQKKDRLTYAVSYVNLNTKFGNSATSSDYTLDQFAASVGYAVNTFEAAFNFEYDSSDTKVFSDSKNNLTEKSAVKTYLTAAYLF